TPAVSSPSSSGPVVPDGYWPVAPRPSRSASRRISSSSAITSSSVRARSAWGPSPGPPLRSGACSSRPSRSAPRRAPARSRCRPSRRRRRRTPASRGVPPAARAGWAGRSGRRVARASAVPREVEGDVLAPRAVVLPVQAVAAPLADPHPGRVGRTEGVLRPRPQAADGRPPVPADERVVQVPQPPLRRLAAVADPAAAAHRGAAALGAALGERGGGLLPPAGGLHAAASATRTVTTWNPHRPRMRRGARTNTTSPNFEPATAVTKRSAGSG